MQVTFNNLLEIEEKAYESPKVVYTHSLRADIKVFIEYIGKSEKKDSKNRDWRISIEGDKATIERCMSEVTKDLTQYLKQRTRNNYSGMKFFDLIDLAKRRSIH